MNDQELQKALDEVRNSIRQDVAAGFCSEEDIHQRALDSLCENYDPEEMFPHIERLTHEGIEAHLERQAAWPARTDCDKLDAAFAELETAGIVARQDFSCCNNCANSEIWEEMEIASRTGKVVRGYTYFHMQDTEAALRGRGVYLGFGAVKEGEETALKIAKEIVASLEHQGLATEWDGTWKTRILVHLDWKRRRNRWLD